MNVRCLIAGCRMGWMNDGGDRRAGKGANMMVMGWVKWVMS